jgi:hypothetical protein
MYNNVIRPALAFVGAVEDELRRAWPHHGKIYFVDIVRGCRLGEDVPLFTPTRRQRVVVRLLAVDLMSLARCGGGLFRTPQ